MAEDKNISFKAGTGTATGIGGLLSVLCQLLPSHYIQNALTIVPFISPVISVLLITMYNKFVEDPVLVETRAKLKRDLKCLKKLQDDKYADDDTREQAKKDYSATILQIANLGKSSIPTPKNNNSESTITE